MSKDFLPYLSQVNNTKPLQYWIKFVQLTDLVFNMKQPINIVKEELFGIKIFKLTFKCISRIMLFYKTAEKKLLIKNKFSEYQVIIIKF